MYNNGKHTKRSDGGIQRFFKIPLLPPLPLLSDWFLRYDLMPVGQATHEEKSNNCKERKRAAAWGAPALKHESVQNVIMVGQ